MVSGRGVVLRICRRYFLFNDFLVTKYNFGHLLWSLHQENPSSLRKPWRLLYFADECTTGNLLKRDNTRKSWCIYFSFMEFGINLLCRDSSWLIGGVLKQPHVDEVEGGFGTATAAFLKCVFSGPNDLRNGISLHTPDGPLMLFVDFGRVLADTPV